MAYILNQKYPVMAGEPHLGYMDESELICDEEEVADQLVEEIVANGLVYSMENLEYQTITLIDNYSEEEIEINTKDFLNIEALVAWYDALTEEEAENWENKPEDQKELDLYSALGILTPKVRNMKYNDDLERALDIERIKHEGVKHGNK